MKQTALDILFDQIKLKADSIPTNTAENRKVKGVYVDCLTLIREYKEVEKEQSIELIKQTAMFMAASNFDEDIANMSCEDVYKTYYNETSNTNEK